MANKKLQLVDKADKPDGKEKQKNFYFVYGGGEWDNELGVYVDKVVEYLDVKGYQVFGNFMEIIVKEGETVIIPMDKVSYIKSTVTVKE